MRIRTLSRMERIFGLTWLVLGLATFLHLILNNAQGRAMAARPEFATYFTQREPIIWVLAIVFFVLAICLYLGWRHIVNALALMIVLPAAALLGALVATALAVVGILAIIFIGGGDGDEIVSIVAPIH